jgi:hypothetical protein
MQTRKRGRPSVILLPAACAAFLLAAGQARAEAPDKGFQLEVAFGGGTDHSIASGGVGAEGGIGAGIGVGLAAQLDAFTVGARFEHNGLLFEYSNNYVLGDVGAHARLGQAKLTGLLEIGVHQLVDVGSGLLLADERNATSLPSAGGRVSIDYVSRSGATIGWWLAYRHDLDTATLDTGSEGRFVLGGSQIETGLQIGVDVQHLMTSKRSSARAGS